MGYTDLLWNASRRVSSWQAENAVLALSFVIAVTVVLTAFNIVLWMSFPSTGTQLWTLDMRWVACILTELLLLLFPVFLIVQLVERMVSALLFWWDQFCAWYPGAWERFSLWWPPSREEVIISCVFVVMGIAVISLYIKLYHWVSRHHWFGDHKWSSHARRDAALLIPLLIIEGVFILLMFLLVLVDNLLG